MRTPDVVHLDGRCLSGNRTGIGVFTAEVVEHWPGAPDLIVHGRPGESARGHRGPWHLRVLVTVLREGGRYLSTDSLIVPALLGARATVVVHDLSPLALPQAQHLRTRLAYRLLLRLVTRRAGAVVVPSLATRDELLRYFPTCRARIQVAAEAPRRLPTPAALPARVTGPFVLHTGTHEPRKNVVDLVAGFLAHVEPPWQLVLAGRRGWLSPAEADRLDGLLTQAGDRVVALGFVSDAVLAGLYAEAGALAYPSTYEGFGLPVVEAMAAGVPVVTTDAAALAELVGPAGLVVPLGPGLADRLGRALAGLTASAPERARLAAAGRERAAGYDWARTAAAVHGAVLSTQAR